MPVPDRYRSAFSRSTLRMIETKASRFRMTSPLFFRGASTANVTESERRSFAPLVMLTPEGVLMWRCTCAAAMQPSDLCRHIAVLVSGMCDEHGALVSERFDRSVWRAIAFTSFTEGRQIVAADADPREMLLRKCALTKQERLLLGRGVGSMRLQFEESGWYRWAKEMFEHGGNEARVEIGENGAMLHLADRAIPLSPDAFEHILISAPEIALRSGFEIAPHSLVPSLRIEITSEGALRLAPVLCRGAAILDRAALPRFGRFFLLGKCFASPAPARAMFAERPAAGQADLFEARPSAGMPYDRETIIAPDEVFAFVETHRDELARMPESLAPEAVRNARPIRLDGEVVFDFAPPHGELLDVAIGFRAGDETIQAGEIARARREGVRALIRGNLWIDVADPQFAWLDETKHDSDGRVLVTRLELMRTRGSLRGSPLFRGDPSCQSVFRLFDEVQADGGAPPVATMGIDLYGYQQIGYQWLWLLQQNGFGALLCDDMGLGKTHQAMALVAAMMGADPTRSVLIVSPTSVLDHWREKLHRYLPGVEVTLTSYGIVRSRLEQFRGRRFDLVILDEMQTIKNADTATHQALRSIEKGIAVGLTGTPIENHEGELKNLIEFIVPGYLPKHVDDRPTLQRLVRPFVLRRTKAQVLTELPPKIVDKRYCELTAEQETLYRRVIEARARPLQAQLRAGAVVSYVHIFAALNYLKQICNHPASAGGGFGDDAPSGKWDLFVELVDECMASGLKVVVFSQYLPMLALIEKHLASNDIGYASIKGATRARGEEIARFRDDPDCRVFTASLRAGGLGIDLTPASVVIHYDRWWNQAREEQATDRVHRLGQSKGVQVLKLITRDTIEEKIDALITRKGALAEDLVRPDDPSLVKQFTREELAELLA